jgi:sec-independent protein translocase protein TatA
MRLEPWHVIVLLLVVVVLFGYKRLPDAARSMGRSMRIFKSEVDSMRHDDDKKPPTPTEPLTGRIVEPTDVREDTRTPDAAPPEKAPDDRR